MIELSEAVRMSRLQVVANAVDNAATQGLLLIYSAPRPDAGMPVTTQRLLAQIEFKKPSTDVLENGVLYFRRPDETIALASATATWARITNGASMWVADVDVGVTGSGAEIELSSVELLAGGSVSITLAELTE